MANLPSVKTLSEVFGDNAKKARQVLEADKTKLRELIVEFNLESWRRQFYNPPRIADVKLAILDKLANTCGTESFQVKNTDWCDYLNAGDTYAPTLVYFRGRYRVSSWGEIAERYGTFD